VAVTGALCAALRVLTDRGATDASVRNRAAEQIRKQLAARLPRTLGDEVCHRWTGMAPADQHNVCEDVLQASLLAALTTCKPFRGTSDAEARAWLLTVAFRSAARYFRKVPQRVAWPWGGDEIAVLAAEETFGSAAGDVKDLLSLVQERFLARRSGRALLMDVDLYVEHLFGSPTKQQLKAAFGSRTTRSQLAKARASAAMRQRRRPHQA
jgi:DNA-directed RNA polymerase specialized sigma24 family protein